MILRCKCSYLFHVLRVEIDELRHFLMYACFYSIGVTERVADIKTRAQAMKCLSTFCEAVGPGFIFERVMLPPPNIYLSSIDATGCIWGLHCDICF